MFTTSFRNTVLGTMGGFVGLIKAITDFRAGTVTEAAYTGYGTRPAIAYGATAATTPAGGRQVSNSGIISFPVNTGAPENEIAYGIWSAATAGTLQAIGFLDVLPPLVGIVDSTSDNLIDIPAHGMTTDQQLFLLAAPGAPMPTGLVENTIYFVLAAGLTADAFKVALTSGGAAINITGEGALLAMPYLAVTVATSATPTIAVGAVVVQI